MINIDGKAVSLHDFIQQYRQLSEDVDTLKKVDSKAKRKFEEEHSLKPFQAELIRLQNYLEDQHKRMIIVFEGRDAAGKGGTIRRVTRYMNEKHYRVVALGRPTEEQRTQWYYQRYVAQFPHAGEMVLFDRSWYNRAMVERVFGFCSEKEYQDFMRGVVGFERDLVRQGTILVKLYFSVTKEEQARRFESRKTDPLIDAPWTVVRSDNKFLARLNAIKVILKAAPYERLNPDLDFTVDSEVVVSGSRELELMEEQRIRGGKFTG
ncbi:MAG: polyphosphate kinase [Gammaproteobacteria bacterium SG8_15]|nr:MAG: polyphosphate kinase [Gammaproteobacteria bacterium SG8_15]